MNLARTTTFGAGIASILVACASFGSRFSLYGAFSSLCMRLADGFDHPGILLITAFATIGTFMLAASATAARQVRRTRRAIGTLVAERTDIVPFLLRLVMLRIGVRNDVVIVESDELIALCDGFLRPRLVFSTGLIGALDEEELEAVVRHEVAHARRLDPLRNLVARSVSATLFFVPLSGGIARAYLCNREISADRVAVSEMNGDALPLASALQRTLAARGQFDAAALAVGGLSATEIRIDHLLGVRTSAGALITPPDRVQSVAFVVVTAVMLCAVLASAHAASGANPCLPC